MRYPRIYNLDKDPEPPAIVVDKTDYDRLHSIVQEIELSIACGGSASLVLSRVRESLNAESENAL